MLCISVKYKVERREAQLKINAFQRRRLQGMSMETKTLESGQMQMGAMPEARTTGKGVRTYT